ncbi:hypothetical protein ACQUQU_08405 [Thalassolituus sp. LLYu03]|uniref:hypothetical protein n=1 Tax=Thalassolituus sp. LLYu03 TaxID=3421656 RepID=UPI003D27ECD9
MMRPGKRLVLLPGALLSACALADGFVPDTSVQLGLEHREFLQQAQRDEQSDRSSSVWLEPELVWDVADNQRLTFKPFYRYDSVDDERTHGDVRELLWQGWGSSWEVRAGIGKVFWGVTESLHLVDVINQTDQVEAPDGEDKLGQPMLHGIWLHPLGTLEAFVLPGFRERTFAGPEGRLSTPLTVLDDALYESSDDDQHIDYALRWSRSFEVSEWPLDVSAAWFSGTDRDPVLLPTAGLVDGLPGIVGLSAFYPQVDQLGITLQSTVDSWLWKLETLHRDYSAKAALTAQNAGVTTLDDYWAAVGGFEYTLTGPFAECCDSALDVGLLLEYQYDERGKGAAFAQNDVFAGTRLAFNDMDSSEILAGVVQDLDFSNSRSVKVEASTRLTEQSTLNLNLWWFMADDQADPAYALRADDYAELSWNWFF